MRERKMSAQGEMAVSIDSKRNFTTKSSSKMVAGDNDS
jgi:hypothetical protein